MKRAVKMLALIIVLCIFCAGCDSWMDGEYLSITPHEARSEPYTDRVIEVSSYTQLRNAITNLVRTGAENGVISISAFNQGTIHFYVDTAIENVIENTAFGAYAVEKITYEIGTNRGASVVACRIHYRQGYQMPNKIMRVENAEELAEMITAALDAVDESVLVYMEQHEKIDVEKLVSEYAEMYPDKVIEIPQITVKRYPEKGAERIVQILFDYKASALELHQMRSKVESMFAAADQVAVQANDYEEQCKWLYTYLMEQAEYRSSISNMPGYDLLIKGKGDSKAFAVTYARMCNRNGLKANIVTGTRDGEPWTWNVIDYRGKAYYVDLLRCHENQEFLMCREEQLVGYVWEK